MAKRIGPVLAVIGSDVKGFTDGLSKSQKQLQQFSATAAVAGARASAAFAATLGVMSAFVIKVGADFELAMSNVRKTVEATPEVFQELETSILDMSTQFGIAATELANFARIGGQLGIDPDQIDEFTEAIAKLSIAAVELDPEVAARGLARIQALTKEGAGSIEKMANVLAKLGDSLATDEGRILDFSERIASFSNAVGLSSEEILGLSAGFSALVGGTERAATAVERFLGELSTAVAQGGDELTEFAELASMALEGSSLSAEDFALKFKEAPLEAIELVIGGMEKLGEQGLAPLLQKFDALGITGVRMLSTFAAGAKGADELRKALRIAAEEAEKQTKLEKELAIQLDTVVRQFDRLKEMVTRVGITLFKAFRDEIMFLISAAQTVVGWLQSIADGVDGLGSVVQFAIIGVIGLVGAIASLLLVLGTLGGLLTGTSALVTTTIGLFAGKAAAATAAAGGIATYGVATGAATATTVSFSAALKAAMASFLPFAAAVAAAAVTFGATFAITREFAGEFRDMSDPINKAASEMGAFTAVVESVKIVGGTAIGFFKEAAVSTGLFSDTVEDLTPSLDEGARNVDFFGREIKELDTTAKEGSTSLLRFLNPITLLNESMIATREETRLADERIRTIAIASELAGERFETLGEATAFLNQRMKEGQQAAAEHAAAMDAASESGSARVDNINETIASMLKQGDAETRVNDVAKALGLTVDELNKKMGTNREEFLRLAEVQIKARDATEEHRKEMDKLRESLRADTTQVAAQNFENFAQVVRETFDGAVSLTDKGTVEMVKRLRELADLAGVELPADLESFATAVETTIGRAVAVAEATKAAKEELSGMSEAAASVSFEGFQAALVEAIETGEKFSIKSTLEILKRLKEGAAESGQAVIEELEFFMLKAQMIANLGIIVPMKVDLPDELPFDDIDFGGGDGGVPGGVLEGIPGGLPSEVDFLSERLKIINKETKEWNESLAAANDIMQVLGISADSTIGNIIGGLSAAGAAGSKFQQSLTEGKLVFAKLKEQAAKAGEEFSFGDFLTSGEGLAAGIQAGSAMLQGAVSVWEAGAAGGIGGAISGALAGAQFGSQIGEMFGPIGKLGGAAIGAGVGAALSLLRGKPEFKKIAEDIGRDFGVQISDELAKQIEKTADELDLGRFEATLLNLGDIITEAGGVGAFGLENTTTAVNDLMNAIAMGAVPAKEGVSELGEVFGQMAEEMFEAGTIADAALLQVVQRSKELGLEVPEIAEFIAGQLAQAASGVTAIIGKAFETEGGEKGFGGIQVASVEDAQSQATIFAAAFFATLEEQGLVAAVDAFEPAFNEMKAKFEQFGADVNFGGVGRFFELAKDPQFRPLLEGIQGLTDAMTGLGNAGFLTADTFNAFQQQGQAAFEQLTEAGLKPAEALQQMAPFLQEAINASQTFGFELDENTQKMIEQAEAAGIGFATDPMTQMVEVLGLIAEQLGVTQEALAGVGVGAQAASQQTTEAWGGAADMVGAAFDEMGIRGESAWGRARDAAVSSAQQQAASQQQSMADTAKAAADSALETANRWAEAAGITGEEFDMLREQTEAHFSSMIESSFIAGDAVSSLGATAVDAAGGFDRMASAARSAAEAARSAANAGGGGGGPPQGGQFGLTTTVREPTLFMAGEAGEERVTIDPGGGGDGGGAPQVVVLQIDGKTIGKVLGDLSRTGDVRIHPSAVKDFG